LLGKSRSAYYFNPRSERRDDIKEKIALKELYLKILFYGYRKMWQELRDEGFIETTAKRVRRLMHEMAIRALSPRKFTSIPNKEHPVYP